jgi:hypothetical protein
MFNLKHNTKHVQEEISTGFLEALKTPHYTNNLVAKHSIKPASYSKEASFKQIEAQIPNPEIAGPDFPYVNGTNYPCAQFLFAVNGSEQALAKIFDENFLAENYLKFNPYNEQKYVVFHVFNDTAIEGDDEVIASINQKATAVRQVIQERIAAFNEEAQAANSELKKFIEEQTPKELAKKQIKVDANDKLDPF